MEEYKQITIEVKRNEDDSFIWNNRNGVQILLSDEPNEESGDYDLLQYCRREWKNLETSENSLHKHIVSNSERSEVAVCCSTCKYVDGCRCNHPQGCETNGDYELWEQKTDC